MNKKILIVDDEQNIRETISEYLLHKNYIVKTAINGEEALELLKSWSPDIIISDIMMPEMDGNELFGFVRENKTLNQIISRLQTWKRRKTNSFCFFDRKERTRHNEEFNDKWRR